MKKTQPKQRWPKRVFNHIVLGLDYLFPPGCLVCGSRDLDQAEHPLCNERLKTIAFLAHPFCRRCGKPFLTATVRDHLCGDCGSQEPQFNVVRALGRYEGALEKIIHKLKYQQKFAMTKLFPGLLQNMPPQEILFDRYDLFIPVPLHPKRLRQRGFNQAVLFGKILQKKYRVPLKTNILQRTVETLSQITLPVKERKHNVRNAFSLKNPAAVEGKAVLLLDDVYTTGSTINECARVLKKSGASRVDGFVLARAV